jgi:hypothetical protein
MIVVIASDSRLAQSKSLATIVGGLLRKHFGAWTRRSFKRAGTALFAFLPEPGGSDAKDAFKHAVVKGDKKKRQKQRGRRGSVAGIVETVANPQLRIWHANAA